MKSAKNNGLSKLRIGIVTVSDRCHAGQTGDESGKFLKKRIAREGWKITVYEVIPDEEKIIAGVLKKIADEKTADLILTTGGTGLAKRDVTPEATGKILEKEIPGLAEVMRMKSFAKTPYAVLSRGRSGFRKETLIINLPGSPKGVRECLEIILPVIPHAVEIRQGKNGHRDAIPAKNKVVLK